MTVEVASQLVDLDTEWSSAEFLDVPLADRLVLRGLVCRLATSQWQWSVISLYGDRGELICSGTARSAAAAQRTVASEISKCVEDPTA